MRVAPAIAVVAGAFVLVGALVDWTGVGYAPPYDREITAAAGAALIVIGLTGLRRPRVLVAAVAPALVAAVMAKTNIDDVRGKLYEFAAMPNARVGVGLYLVGAGAALGFGAAAAGAAVWRGTFGTRRA